MGERRRVKVPGSRKGKFRDEEVGKGGYALITEFYPVKIGPLGYLTPPRSGGPDPTSEI